MLGSILLCLDDGCIGYLLGIVHFLLLGGKLLLLLLKDGTKRINLTLNLGIGFLIRQIDHRNRLLDNLLDRHFHLDNLLDNLFYGNLDALLDDFLDNLLHGNLDALLDDLLHGNLNTLFDDLLHGNLDALLHDLLHGNLDDLLDNLDLWSHSGNIRLLLGGRFLSLLLLGRLGLHEVVLSGLIDLLFDGLLTLLRLGSDRLRCFLWTLFLARLLLESVVQVIADDGCYCKGNQRSQNRLQGIDPRATLVHGILLGLLCGSHFAALILRTFTFHYFFR